MRPQRKAEVAVAIYHMLLPSKVWQCYPLLDREEEMVAEVIAFMSYKASIGRVLQKGGVKKFIRITKKLVVDLHRVKWGASFDGFRPTNECSGKPRFLERTLTAARHLQRTRQKAAPDSGR